MKGGGQGGKGDAHRSGGKKGVDRPLREGKLFACRRLRVRAQRDWGRGGGEMRGRLGT